MKRWMMLAALTAMAMVQQAAVAAVSVTNVKATPRWPWNGLVDIDYTVASDKADDDIYVYPVGKDGDRNLSITPRTLTGDGANATVKPGTHRMTWNASADDPTFNSSAFTMKIMAFSGAAPYLVVDLSGGTNAASYPVTTLSGPPGGAWGDEYKTSNLVLRLIVPGTFMMGSPDNELGRSFDETLHQVTFTKPYYIGVFELTQKQWQLVMGTTPSSYRGDARPVENVSYNDIRGTANGASWPANGLVGATSFMGVLRTKTDLSFDLPTEAQWEYACRAGTSTAFNSGKDLISTSSDANMAEVGRYDYNTSDGKGGYSSYHTKVGSYLPNAWGLYDMHGNVWEWCLDWYGTLAATNVSDPVGGASGSSRLIRGGCWNYNAIYCRSAFRNYNYPANRNYNYGFRLSLAPGL